MVRLGQVGRREQLQRADRALSRDLLVVRCALRADVADLGADGGCGRAGREAERRRARWLPHREADANERVRGSAHRRWDRTRRQQLRRSYHRSHGEASRQPTRRVQRRAEALEAKVGGVLRTALPFEVMSD